MDRALAIAVVGAGTAGAAAALLLARAGHAVTVLEAVPAPGPVGAGITLQPTGQAVLARLGLLDAVAARAAPIDRLWCRTAGGRTLVDLRYADVDPDLVGLGVHRGALFETLFGALRAEPGVVVRCGVTIDRMRADAAGRWLDARELADPLGPFDLVVIADGAVSELHASATIPHRVTPYPWGAMWFVARGASSRTLHQRVRGARRMLGFLPTGLDPTGDHPIVTIFWSVRADRVDAMRAAGLAAWRAEARALARESPSDVPLDMIDQVTDLDQLVFTRYRDVRMRRWHEPGAVFLGDAAHATSPQLGQGANLALWDAMVLADVVAAASTVDAALAAYTAARRRHLAYYQLATRALTPLFQGDSRVLGFARDLVFPLSRWFGPLRRRMVRTMVGIDRGLVRRPIPLAEVKRLLLAAPASASHAPPRHAAC